MCDSCKSWPAPACECIRLGHDSGTEGCMWEREVRWRFTPMLFFSQGFSPSLLVLLPSAPLQPCSTFFLLVLFFFTSSRTRSGQAELSHSLSKRGNWMNTVTLKIFHKISSCGQTVGTISGQSKNHCNLDSRYVPHAGNRNCTFCFFV